MKHFFQEKKWAGNPGKNYIRVWAACARERFTTQIWWRGWGRGITLKYSCRLHGTFSSKFWKKEPNQLNMAVFFWYLVKIDLSSTVYATTYYIHTSVHWTSHFLQGTKNTRPCLSSRVVDRLPPNPWSPPTWCSRESRWRETIF